MAIRRHQTFLLRGKGRCLGLSIIKPKSLLCNQDISNNLYWTPSRPRDRSGFEIDWFHFALWYSLLKVIVCVFRSAEESSLDESGHDFSISVSLGGSVRWSVSSLRLKTDVWIDIIWFGKNRRHRYTVTPYTLKVSSTTVYKTIYYIVRIYKTVGSTRK